MAIETTCQTNGVIFHTQLEEKKIVVKMDLPKNLNLTEKEAELLEANLHNAIELVLAPHFYIETQQALQKREE